MPEDIRPYLLQLAVNKCPDDLWFGRRREGGVHAKLAMGEMARRLCARAGVSSVCTHSRRGLWATLVVESGAASHAAAASLRPHSLAGTERHYAQRAAVANAATARMFGVMGGERLGDRPNVRGRLKQLGDSMLAWLLALLESEEKNDDPN